MLKAIANFDDLKLFPVCVPLKDYSDTTLFVMLYLRLVFLIANFSDQCEQLLAHGHDFFCLMAG
jgi:hypothetical protein